MKTTERGLVAALVISNIVSVLLIIYNVFYALPGNSFMIPIFLMIMPAIYFETKKQLESENKIFQHKEVSWVLLSFLIITGSVNLILSLL